MKTLPNTSFRIVMMSLTLITIILTTSCSRRYGCYYGAIQTRESIPANHTDSCAISVPNPGEPEMAEEAR